MKMILVVVRKLLAVAAAVVLLGGAGWGVWVWKASGRPAENFRTQPATRGNLVATINSTGTLVPEEVIDVGAQVAGQIVKFGPDLDNSARTIDYRARVEPGTLLAQIDDKLYKAAVDIAAANLAVAEADVVRTATDLDQMKAQLAQAERDWQRAQQLGPGGAISQLDFDTIKRDYLKAKAAVPGGEAALLRARRNVLACQAALDQAKINLGYTRIVSPVKGVIIDRRVNIGQTVVSSLTAPSLFLIAKDLTRMQVWATVNEADVGSIRPGQKAEFTVDTFPHDVFTGEVYQTRYNATMNQNVVTYTVVVNTDNKDLKLIPYLTANLFFKVDERSGALLVPNAALRWKPAPAQVAPEYRDAYEQAQRRKAMAEEGKGGVEKGREPGRGTVWVEDQGFVRPIKVRTGLTDGTRTEVVEVNEGELRPDTPLITGENKGPAGGPGAENPFAPKVFGGKKQPQ
jgi:HlyD family secretion protein